MDVVKHCHQQWLPTTPLGLHLQHDWVLNPTLNLQLILGWAYPRTPDGP